MIIGTRKKIDIRAFTYSLMLLFNSICILGNELLPNLTDFGNYLAAFIIVCYVISLFPLKNIILTNGVIEVIGIIALVGIYEIISYFRVQLPTYIISFIVWTVLAMFIAMQKFDLKKMLDISLFISGFTMVLGVIKSDSYEAMTWSYALFPCIAVAFVHFYLYNRESNMWMKAVYIISIITTIVFIFSSNRGGLVSLVCLFFLLLIRKFKNGTSKKRILINALFVLTLLMAIFFAESLLIALYRFLSSHNIKIDAINKTYRMLLEDNITNNRDELYRFAWQGFLANPIFGNGIGAFAVNHGGWPHNILLQLLYEGGITLAVIVLMPVVVMSVKMVAQKEVDSKVYALFVLLFSIAVPRLLFTSELWNTQSYWMLLVFSLLPKIGETKNRYIVNSNFIVAHNSMVKSKADY